MAEEETNQAVAMAQFSTQMKFCGWSLRELGQNFTITMWETDKVVQKTTTLGYIKGGSTSYWIIRFTICLVFTDVFSILVLSLHKKITRCNMSCVVARLTMYLPNLKVCYRPYDFYCVLICKTIKFKEGLSFSHICICIIFKFPVAVSPDIW